MQSVELSTCWEGDPVSLCERIKSSFTLHEVAAMVGVELPQRAGQKFSSPFRPDRHPSCTVYCHGDNWRFKDWSTGTDLDQIGFYALRRGIENGQAIRELAEKLDSVASNITRQPAPRFPEDRRAPPPRRSISKPLPMPKLIDELWHEGLAHLTRQTDLQRKIADWRGWPMELVAQLVADEMMAAPLYSGRRLPAFRVDYPECTSSFDKSFRTIQIGWHVRLAPRSGNKADWNFCPNRSQGGNSIPALPFIIGDFTAARLLVITEGQWDAITFAHAAGWLSHDTAWPPFVCVLGIRGAQGVNPFLDYYESLWPTNAKCLLLPDNDASGASWYEEQPGGISFFKHLVRRCGQVFVQTVTRAKDFNEAWKQGLVRRQDINHLFVVNGFTTEKGTPIL